MTEAMPPGYTEGPPPQQPYPAQQPYPTQQQQPYPTQQQQPYPAKETSQPYVQLQQPLPVKMAWTHNPTPVVCTNCKTQQTTVLRKKIGFMNWVVVGIVAFVLFDLFLWPCIPLAFIALCIDGLKDTEHVCPNCNFVNGVKKK